MKNKDPFKSILSSEAISSLNKISENLRIGFPASRSMLKVTESLNRVTTGLIPKFEAINKANQQFSKSLGGLTSFMSSLPKINPDFMVGLEERIKEQTLFFADQGWFFDDQMPMTLHQVKKLFEEDNHDEANLYFKDYFSENIDRIKLEIVQQFNHRKEFLEDAFEAHNLKKYSLSIPVLLAQADGVSQEKTNYQLYNKKSIKGDKIIPKISEYIEELVDDQSSSYGDLYLYPLTHLIPIHASASDRGENFNQLNRHLVLHGESLDYHTEENSLKAISWLNYVCKFLCENNEKESV